MTIIRDKEFARATVSFVLYILLNPIVLFLAAGTLAWGMDWVYTILGITAILLSRLAALQFLEKNGYREINTAPRMFLFKEVDWRPEMVFSRGLGYCG